MSEFFLVYQNGEYKVYDKDKESWISVEKNFKTEGMTNFSFIPPAAWKELGSFEILKWIEGEEKIETVQKKLLFDQSYKDNGLLKKEINKEQYPYGVQKIKIL